MDVLFLREQQQLLDAFLAADAGLLESSERRADEMAADLVDPHIARFGRIRGAQRRGEVVGPDRAREADVDRIEGRLRS